jgi:DNA repair protein RadC
MAPQSNIPEINISYNPPTVDDPIVVRGPDTAYETLVPWFPMDTIGIQEHSVVLFLNRAKEVKGIYKLSKGGINSTIVDVRIIFAIALKSLSGGIIIAHNHPSGTAKPSKEDIKLTKKLKAAGDLLDIELLDHIILTPSRGYVSLKTEGVF